MGSLGSRNGVGLFLGWITNSQIPKPGKRSNGVSGWNAIAASSRHGLALFAAGAQLQLLDFLSCSSDIHERFKRHNSSLHGQSAEQHWARRLFEFPLASSGKRLASHSHWTLGMLMSRPWRCWNISQEDLKYSSSSKLSLAALGGGHEGSPSARGYPSRTLTNVILSLNVLVFLGQIASKGRLLLWGAKVNALIDQGQFWRLMTPSLLHANIFHLLINVYSLNSIGPTVESLAGPKRFLAVYSVSALTSTTLSYFCCAAPSVGSSGAIFGLVGALAVFLLRHKNMMVGGQGSLQQVARVIAVNMLLGLVSEGIDNWSHFGGLVGGAAITWLLGPVYSFEMPPGGGRRQLVDRPPISYLLPSQVTRTSL